MEAEMKLVFQQKVSEKEKKLQRSEADLFARHKEMKDKLTKQIKLLEEKKAQLKTKRCYHMNHLLLQLHKRVVKDSCVREGDV